jgi:ABC-type transport system involved in multi-copper enzyme maturation permease subunit
VTDALYERVYEPYEGDRTSHFGRILAIAKESFKATTGSKWLWLLLAATLVHVAVRGVVPFVTGQIEVPEGAVGPEARQQIEFTTAFLMDAFGLQARWILLLALALVASPAISRDAQSGGFSFYFSKPVTRTGYGIGKLLPPVTIGMIVTALPVLVIWLLGVAFTPEAVYPDNVWTLPILITLAGLVVSAAASLLALGLSAVSSSRNLAAVVWVGIGLVSAVAAGLLQGITGNDATGLVDVFGTFNAVADTVLGVGNASVPTWGAWLVTLGWAIVGAAGMAYVFHDQEVTA